MTWFWHILNSHMGSPIGSLIGFIGLAILLRMNGHWPLRREVLLVVLIGTILLMVGIVVCHLIFGCWQA